MADMTMRLRSNRPPSLTGVKSSSMTTSTSGKRSAGLALVAAVELSEHRTLGGAHVQARQAAIAEAPAFGRPAVFFVVVAVTMEPMVLVSLLPEEHVFHRPDAFGG